MGAKAKVLGLYFVQSTSIYFLGTVSEITLCFCSAFQTIELEQLKDHFQLLSALPASTRVSLLQQISELLQDPTAIGALQIVVSGTRGVWAS